jgi:peptidoglycan-N-acetylglucosamine deacetylase
MVACAHPMSPKLCSINIDLDEIPHYWAIHGVAGKASGSTTAVYDVAVQRLCDLGKALDVPLTFFVIGQDMQRPDAAAALTTAAAQGHGVGNHTLSHLYDLTRRGRDEIVREIDEGAKAIERVTGARPVGFRAPGYTITDEIFDVLRMLGFSYDSSVFPCPAYMALKDTAIASYALLGRPSRSVIDTPAVLTAPTQPYRIGTPYWKRGDGLLEIPIQVTRGLRLPYFGTPLMMAGVDGARWLTRGVVGDPFVNLELHGIDVLDDTDPGLAALAQHQKDLRVPVSKKLAVLTAVVETLRAAGYSFVTLDEGAARLS